jgi:hypothetical protein
VRIMRCSLSSMSTIIVLSWYRTGDCVAREEHVPVKRRTNVTALWRCLRPFLPASLTMMAVDELVVDGPSSGAVTVEEASGELIVDWLADDALIVNVHIGGVAVCGVGAAIASERELYEKSQRTLLTL